MQESSEVMALQEELRDLRKRSVEDAKKLRTAGTRAHELEAAMEELRRNLNAARGALDQSVSKYKDLEVELEVEMSRARDSERACAELEEQVSSCARVCLNVLQHMSVSVRVQGHGLEWTRALGGSWKMLVQGCRSILFV